MSVNLAANWQKSVKDSLFFSSVGVISLVTSQNEMDATNYKHRKSVYIFSIMIERAMALLKH